MPLRIFSNSDEERLAKLAIIHLRSQGILQTQIPSYLKVEVSQSYISKVLTEASRLGLLDMRPTVNRDKIDSDDWRRMNESFFPQEGLLRKIRDWAPPPNKGIALNIVYSDDIRDFCASASKVVINLLKYSRNVGVLGGITVFKLLDSHRTEFKPSLDKDLRFVPLSASSTFMINQGKQQYAASPIAAACNRAFNRGSYDDPSLDGVPAYISSQENVEAIRSYIERIPGYQEIFGSPNKPKLRPHINAIDTVITGIGAIAPQSKAKDESAIGEFLRERISAEGITPSNLASIAHGDLAGHLIQRDDKELADEELSQINKYNDGWTGLKGHDLMRIASRAAKKQKPGVIVAAFERGKAKALRGAIKEGLINTLCISSELSDELAKLN